MSMSMKWNIVIDGQEIPFKAFAAIPQIYRMRFQQDIYKALRDLEKGIDKNDPENSNLALLTIGMVNDMYVESRNDEHKYAVVAMQEDFDRF